jgi:branched-chain amino acid transport system substrate-binding protein
MIKKLAYISGLITWLWNLPAISAVTIAVISPKAGVYARQGTEIFEGVRHAIDEINANGGILKQKIKLLPIDDQCNNNIALSTAHMLALNKHQTISLIVGPFCSNDFEETTSIYASSGILQIIPTAISPSLKKVKQKGLIKMLGYSSGQAVDFFEYYNKHFAGETVALLENREDAESVAVAEAVRDEFQKHGKSVMLKSYTYQENEIDTKIKYDTLAAKIVAEKNKIAYVTGTSKNIRKMVRYLKSEWSDFIIFTEQNAATDEYFEYLGNDAEGTYFLSLNRQVNDPDLAEEMVKLRLSGFTPEGLSLYGYSAVKIWEALVRQVGTFNYAKISKKINGNKIKTSLGSYYFVSGAPKNNEKYTIQHYHNGTFEKVY